MRLRISIKVLRKIFGVRRYSKNKPGYRWTTALRAQDRWVKAKIRQPEATPDI